MSKRTFHMANSKNAHKITHYYFYDKLSGEISVKDALEFICQGGLTGSWGRQWRAIRAKDAQDAERIARAEISAVPLHKPQPGERK